MGENGSRQVFRRIAVGILVVLTCVFTLVAVSGSWAGRNLLDTDRFVSRVGPVIEEPVVQDAVAGFLTREVMQLVDPAALFTEAFDGPAAQLLAGPLAGALEGFVHDGVERVVSSDAFARLWNVALTRAHHRAMLVLRDEGTVAETSDGRVRLDLAPVISTVLERIASVTPALFDNRPVPTTSPDDSLADVKARIEQVTGVTLPDDFGQILVYQSSTLDAAQQGLRWFEQGVWAGAILAVVCAVGALLLSVSRRRTALQLIVGVAIVTVLLRRVVLKVQQEVPGQAKTESGVEAIGIVLDRFIQPLLTFTGWALAVLAVIALVLAVTGPYGWAKRFRSSFAEGGWLPQHRDIVGPAAIGGAFLLLLFADLDWWAMAVVVAGAAGVWLAANRSPETPTDTPTAAPETTPAG